MYITVSRPADNGRAGPRDLRLAAVAQRTGIDRREFRPQDHDYFRDLYGTFGLAADQEGLAAGRVSFTDLVEAVLPDLKGHGDRFDLAVMASAAPDAEPGFPMCFLDSAVPDVGLVFGVADLGLLGVFTALWLAENRSRLDARRILVFALDQASVLHSEPVPAHLRVAEDAVTVLVLDADAAHRVETAQPHPVPPDQVAARWSALLAGERPAAVTALAGPGLVAACGDRLPAGTVAVPAGRPASGIWSVLAAEWDGWRRTGRRVLLADYDPGLGQFAHCAITVEAGPVEPGAVEPGADGHVVDPEEQEKLP
ncbi:hypothetical protein [Micromonospora carbonacea]|uniref:Uncharacterized protein n=1 Tax=Micromonospora carbonacea TaxID=47853 RepID=A0A7H8XFC7_9ACTN|nr:hypothetical protein [Micromonospora carbonacea]MBB5829131.1 hypothetical protein [Micromonospora carbonacea]QLD23384.1 hypothetical protein HXZ27_03365 [Micromonospora carbonacea]